MALEKKSIKMVKIYNQKEINILRESGRKLARLVNLLSKEIKIGKKTIEIDKLARELFQKEGGKPSFLNYQGFPAALCVSINDEVVHTAPSKRQFKNGDIVGLDAGMSWKGYHTDMAVTLPVGKIDEEKAHFIKTTKKALVLAISLCRPGITVGDIGFTIQNFVEREGYSVVRELAGHGTGKELHMEPSIPNFGQKGQGQKLKKGMVLAIEPIINMGKSDIISEKQRQCIRSKDGSLSAHFEHTIVINDNAAEILTKV